MALNNLLLHPLAQSALQALLASPPHSLLLSGLDGIGKYTTALTWAKQLNPDAPIRTIEPDDKHTISVETVRNLYRESRAKRTDAQVLIIRDAEAMTTEAQNAFLKLLEEPPRGVIFVLTTARREALLPTIRSRVQQIELHPLPSAQLQQHLLAQKPDISQQDIAQLLFVAAGRPGVLRGLLQSPEQLAAERARMQTAKGLLSDPPYNRYLAVTKLAAERDECQRVLDAMLLIVSAQLQRTVEAAAQHRWLQIADALQTAQQNIRQNGNVKAQLLALLSEY